MIESNPVYDEMVDALWVIVQKRRRGEMLTHTEIQSVVDIPPNVGHWQHVMNRVRRRLEDTHSISMIVVQKEGYKLCTVDEQIALGPWRLRRAVRQLRRGERSLKALSNVKTLTTNQRTRQVASLEAVAKHRRSLNTEAQTVVMLVKPSQINPRRTTSQVEQLTGCP